MSVVARIVLGDADDVPRAADLMQRAFDPRFGEAWTAAQTLGVLTMPGARLWLAQVRDRLVGFALTRTVLDECELMLIAVDPLLRGGGLGARLLDRVRADADEAGLRRIHLEVRKGNGAASLYTAKGFRRVAERKRYYRGPGGHSFDAETYVLLLPAE